VEKAIVDARDLIELFLELKALQKDKTTWTEKGIADDPPRRIWFQRMRALVKAFGLKTEVSTFDQGEFIDSNDPAYGPLSERIRLDVAEDDDVLIAELNRERAMESNGFSWIFQDLLR